MSTTKPDRTFITVLYRGTPLRLYAKHIGGVLVYTPSRKKVREINKRHKEYDDACAQEYQEIFLSPGGRAAVVAIQIILVLAACAFLAGVGMWVHAHVLPLNFLVGGS